MVRRGWARPPWLKDVCGRFAGDVLWGRCVHFGAASVPFAALASALDGWAAGAGEVARDEVLAGLDALNVLLPGVGSGRAGDQGLVLQQLDTALVRIARRRPTVLVIDDLQWADASSLDLLAFLISGFRDQRLAVVATVRDEDRPEGHPVNTWLAEVRRMPGVDDLHLTRLGPQATTEQVAALPGGAVSSEALAARVYERSGGNPYLSELLMRADPLGTSEPGVSVSEALREALLSRWHSLSASARQCTRVLAIGGRPVDLDVLEAVTALADAGWADGATVRESVAEAVTAGVLERPAGSRVWFRHPLIAEVLTSGTRQPPTLPQFTPPTPRRLPSGLPKSRGTSRVITSWLANWQRRFGGLWSPPIRLAWLRGKWSGLNTCHGPCRLWPQVRT